MFNGVGQNWIFPKGLPDILLEGGPDFEKFLAGFSELSPACTRS